MSEPPGSRGTDWSAYAPTDGDLPSSPSALRNREPILKQLRSLLNAGDRVLEIASGTGEHAVFLAENMPDIHIQPTDVDLDAMGLRARLLREALPSVAAPFVLDIAHWPSLRPKFDCVLSINCIHIAPEDLLPSYVQGAASSLKKRGIMVLYGPFRYEGKFDTESNEAFDAFLRDTYPGGGIRDFETVDALANTHGMTLQSDTAMPANNRLIVWQKS